MDAKKIFYIFIGIIVVIIIVTIIVLSIVLTRSNSSNKSLICKSDSDCNTGFKCDPVKSYCVPFSCTKDNDCINGFLCNTLLNVCVQKRSCNNDSDCTRYGGICIDSICRVLKCNSDSDCNGRLCDPSNNTCIENVLNCNNQDFNCPSYHICTGLGCKQYKCSKDDDCRYSINDNYICDVDVGYCVKKHLCIYDLDCPSGHTCDVLTNTCVEAVNCKSGIDCINAGLIYHICDNNNKCSAKNCVFNSDCNTNKNETNFCFVKAIDGFNYCGFG